jgi:hypothetical protein
MPGGPLCSGAPWPGKQPGGPQQAIDQARELGDSPEILFELVQHFP